MYLPEITTLSKIASLMGMTKLKLMLEVQFPLLLTILLMTHMATSGSKAKQISFTFHIHAGAVGSCNGAG